VNTNSPNPSSLVSSLEILESRIAPSSFQFVSSLMVKYTDPDGDHVTVTSTKPVFTNDFSQFVSTPSGSAGGDQLETLDLTKAPGGIATAQGAAITIAATPFNGHGDGWVNVGSINATGADLLSVSVKGDLGQIDAGDATTTTPAIGTLTIHSLGLFGKSTQATPDHTSDITGAISTLTINGDVVGSSIKLTGGTNGVDGKLGTVTIKGSIIGGDTQGTGLISASGNIGLMTVQGNIVGGAGDDSGKISAGGNILGLTVGGSLIGGDGAHSGEVNVAGNASGLIKIGHDVNGGTSPNSGRIEVDGNATGISVGGSLNGSRHSHTGEIIVGTFVNNAYVGGNAGVVTIGGNINGGDNATQSATATPIDITNTGYIQAGHFTSVTVNGSIFSGNNTSSSTPNGGQPGSGPGGKLINSGAIRAAHDIPLVHVFGDIVGNSNTSVVISAVGQTPAPATGPDLAIGSFTAGGRVSFANIEAGYDLTDAAVNANGSIGTFAVTGDFIGSEVMADKIGTVTVGGSVVGNQANTGLINVTGGLGLVTIKGNLDAGGTNNSGAIFDGGNALAITVGGSVLGGGGADSGEIKITGNAGLIHVGHDVSGGSSATSGRIEVDGNTPGISVGGSLNGARHSHTGEIIVGGNAGIVTIGADINGGDNATQSATATPIDITNTGYIQAGHFTSVTVNGSIFSGNNTSSSTPNGGQPGSGPGGALTNSGAIRAAHDIPLVHVFGDIVGNSNTSVVISGKGQATPPATTPDLAIGSFIAGGRVTFANIEAGYDLTDTAVNANGSIGSLAITGDFFGSEAVADKIGTVGVGGSVIGASGNTGMISATGGLGAVTIKGNLAGGNGNNSGAISDGGNALGISVGGSVLGGSGLNSGQIKITGNAGLIHVGHDVSGGNSASSGRIEVDGNTLGVSVGGSLNGARHNHTGEIIVGGNAGIVSVGGDINGGDNATQSATPTPIDITNTGFIQAGHFTSVTVNGSIFSGFNTSSSTPQNGTPGSGPGGKLTNSGAIRATNDIPLIHVFGDLTGNATNPVVISAKGLATLAANATTDLAIGGLTVGGRVTNANIEAGFDTSDNAVNGSAQIGTILVGGDWVASNAIVGIAPGPDKTFGDTTDDARAATATPNILAKIASITVGGQVAGTPASGDIYAFEAQQIGLLSIGALAQPLQVGAHNDNFKLSATTGSDVAVLEL
jgi:hypothetical protein